MCWFCDDMYVGTNIWYNVPCQLVRAEGKNMYKVVFALDSNVSLFDELFETEYQAAEALFDYLEMEYQFDNSGEYDVEHESTYYAIVEE